MNEVGYAEDAVMRQDRPRSYESLRELAKATEQVRQAEIPHQLEKLERTLKGCMQGLESLGARLEASVMRGEATSPADIAKEQDVLPFTGLGAHIRTLTSVAAEINARIQSISARLEV